MWFWTINVYCLKCVSMVLYLYLILTLSAVGLLTLPLHVSSLLLSSSFVSKDFAVTREPNHGLAAKLKAGGRKTYWFHFKT